MDILIGFIIGLVYAPAVVIFVTALVKAGAGIGIVFGAVATGILAGPAVWILAFIMFGVAAGFMAFAGWVIGLGIAALIVFLELSSRFRSSNSNSHSTAS